MKTVKLLMVALLLTAGNASPEKATPLTLETALARARESNPDLLIARHRIASARAALDEANAAFWPAVELQSGYSAGNHPVQVFGWSLRQRAFTPELDFNRVPTADNLNVRTLLTVPLFQGGRALAGHRSAGARLRTSELEGVAARNQLEFDVAHAWFSLLKTRQFIRAAEASVRSFESNLEVARHRVQAGTLLETDLLNVEVRLAQARETLVHARNGSRLAKLALHYLLGEPDATFQFSDDLPRLAEPPLETVPSRPEVEAARSQTLSAREEIKKARAERLPQVNGFGAFDHDRGWKFDGSGNSWTAGIVLQWTLWDGQAARSKVRRAESELEAALELERKTRLQSQFEVEQSRVAVLDARERLAVTDTMVNQAETSANLTRARFEQGLALAHQLFEAEHALTVARVRRAETEANLHSAIAALRKAFGLSQTLISSGPHAHD